MIHKLPSSIQNNKNTIHYCEKGRFAFGLNILILLFCILQNFECSTFNYKLLDDLFPVVSLFFLLKLLKI